VPSHDLSSIQGLADKHLRVLGRNRVTELRGLVQADPELIYRAMVNLRPRPTRDQIARWQDDATSMLGEPGPNGSDESAPEASGKSAPDASDTPAPQASDTPSPQASDRPEPNGSGQPAPDASEWQTVASFVVVFSHRHAGGTWERRVEAERTEVEPERNPQVWTGWDCEPVCGWMLGQLNNGSGATPQQAPDTETASAQARPAAEPPPAVQAPAAPVGPAQLRIDSAAIIDAAGQADVLISGAPVANPRTELVAPVRVVLTVTGAPPETRLEAVTRILRPDRPGWNPQDPVPVPDSGQAEFDLSRVPAGEYEMSLITWAPDATAKPVSVRLPRMTIRSAGLHAVTIEYVSMPRLPGPGVGEQWHTSVAARADRVPWVFMPFALTRG
jgi:hypothetical protein